MNTPVSQIFKVKEQGNKLLSIDPADNVFDCVNQMNSEGVGLVVVMDDGEIAGILSERDICRKVVAQNLVPKDTLAGDVMTVKVPCVKSTTTIEEAMAVITSNRRRHLLVVDNDEIIGVISIGDLTKWVSDEQKDNIDNLVSYIDGSLRQPL